MRLNEENLKRDTFLESIQPAGCTLSSMLKEYESNEEFLLPLPPHSSMAHDELFRSRYAAMLVRIADRLGLDGAQDRQLLASILGSLGLMPTGQSILALDNVPHEEEVLVFLADLNRNNLALSFLIDAAILFQAGRKLMVGALKHLEDWIDALNINEPDRTTVGAVADLVLQGTSSQQIPESFDWTRISTWSGYLFQPLTAERLEESCLGGYWLVDQPLSVSKPWQLSGARLLFTEHGSLHTEASGKVLIEDTTLIRPRLTFSGSDLNLCIKDSRIRGRYSEAAPVTAIQLNAIGGARFNKLQVSTVNARSFLVLQTPTEFAYCRFDECGSLQLAGAGIAVKNGIVKKNWLGKPKAAYVSISANCILFVDCVSRRGGSESPENLGGGEITNIGDIDCYAFNFGGRRTSVGSKARFYRGTMVVDNSIEGVTTCEDSIL